MSTANIIAIVAAAIALVGLGATLAIYFAGRRTERARESREQEAAVIAREAERRTTDAARPKLSAEYLAGPTPAGASSTGFVYRYRVDEPRHPICWRSSYRTSRCKDTSSGEPNGASVMGSDGLLHPGDAVEATITVPSLDHEMKLKISWYVYEDPIDPERSHVSRVPVPLSVEQGRIGWNASRGSLSAPES